MFSSSFCKFLRVVGVVLAVSLVAAVLPAGAAGAAPVGGGGDLVQVEYEVTFAQGDARGMLDDINAFRTGGEAWVWNESDSARVPVGSLPALSYSYELERVAMQRAAEAALTFEHIRPNGTSCFTTAEDLGVTSGFVGGENIAVGYADAASVFEGFCEENAGYAGQGHRRNMLGNHEQVGIGHVIVNGTNYWAQEFGFGLEEGTPNPDGEQTVLTEVSLARVTSLEITGEPSLSEISLAGGESAALPTLTGRISFANSWSVPELVIHPAWAGGGKVVELRDGRAIGHLAGETTLTASFDGRSYSLPITVTSTAHTFDAPWNVLQSPSCTEAGLRERVCSFCGETVTEPAPPLGHDYVAQDGVFTCSRCGLSHDYLPGDVNGDGTLTAVDRTLLARALAGWEGVGAISTVAADVDADGALTSRDRTTIARALAGWEGIVM